MDTMTITGGGLSNRQLALILAVEAATRPGDTASLERLANKFLAYLTTGNMNPTRGY